MFTQDFNSFVSANQNKSRRTTYLAIWFHLLSKIFPSILLLNFGLCPSLCCFHQVHQGWFNVCIINVAQMVMLLRSVGFQKLIFVLSKFLYIPVSYRSAVLGIPVWGDRRAFPRSVFLILFHFTFPHEPSINLIWWILTFKNPFYITINISSLVSVRSTTSKNPVCFKSYIISLGHLWKRGAGWRW